jgi:hypothetical protein
LTVAVGRSGAAPLDARARVDIAAAPGLPLATLACSAACSARTTVARRGGRTIAAGAVALPGAGTGAVAVRARRRLPGEGRAIATTTLTGSGPDQTARQAVPLHR